MVRPGTTNNTVTPLSHSPHTIYHSCPLTHSLPRTHKHQADLADVKAHAAAAGVTDELLWWDVAFWAERLREAKYDLKDEELRPYFALPAVLDGLFKVNLLFCLLSWCYFGVVFASSVRGPKYDLKAAEDLTSQVGVGVQRLDSRHFAVS